MIGTVEHPITLVELQNYADDADVIFSSDRHERLKELLAFNPEHGEIIKDTGGVRHFIWAVNEDAGEEVQVVYFFRDLTIPLFLVAICHQPFEEFDPAFCKELKALSEDLVAEYQRQKEILMQPKGSSA